MSLDILDLSQLKWYKIPGINRFRHSTWINGSKLYIFGGFESNSPDVPTDHLLQASILKLLDPLPNIQKQLSELMNSTSQNLVESLHQSMFKKYDLTSNVVVAHIGKQKNTPPNMIHLYPLNALHKEAGKLKSNCNKMLKLRNPTNRTTVLLRYYARVC